MDAHRRAAQAGSVEQLAARAADRLQLRDAGRSEDDERSRREQPCHGECEPTGRRAAERGLARVGRRGRHLVAV